MLVAQILWNSLHLLPLVVALAVALAAAVRVALPAQVRRVRRPWRWVLPGLRAAALLALAASLLQPVVQRLRRAEERGAVLVLVDRSQEHVGDRRDSHARAARRAGGRAGPAAAGAGGRRPRGWRAELERLRARLDDVVSAGNDVETAEAFGRGIEAADATGLVQSRARSTAPPGRSPAPRRALPATRGRCASESRRRLDVPDEPPRDAWAADARARIDAARRRGRPRCRPKPTRSFTRRTRR